MRDKYLVFIIGRIQINSPFQGRWWPDQAREGGGGKNRHPLVIGSHKVI